MPDIMIRVETEDYDAWLKTHYDHVEDRHSYGMTDGPVYRDITPMRRCSTSTSRRTSTVRCSGFERTRSRKRRSGPRSLVGTSTWPRSSNLALRRNSFVHERPNPLRSPPRRSPPNRETARTATAHRPPGRTSPRPRRYSHPDPPRSAFQAGGVPCSGFIRFVCEYDSTIWRERAEAEVTWASSGPCRPSCRHSAAKLRARYARTRKSCLG
jgi:hypothetical protein